MGDVVEQKREFDVVVWGATGFTGRLVARYLCAAYGVDQSVRWAIAGRNAAKLDKLRDELKDLDAAAGALPIVVGDSHDAASLTALVSRTRVVLTTVGPYMKYGATLVQACVDAETDYVDLTGETPFIRQMIDAHHERASAKGIRIVHCCGFDSIPSDMGVYYLQQQAKTRWGGPAESIGFYLEHSKGGVSGGTIASMMLVLEAVKDPTLRRVVGNPYGLNPKDGVRGPDGSDQQTVRWNEEIGVWTAPFVMAGINTRVVRRSNALMEYAYGKAFSYREVMALKRGFRSWMKAQSMTLGLGAVIGLSMMKWTRPLLFRTILPRPGEGPSPEAQEAGFFRIRLVGKKGDQRMDVRVQGKRDPGYGATARMLTEAALSLALERDALPKRFGVLTPASAMGDVLVSRLARADVTFTVLD